MRSFAHLDLVFAGQREASYRALLRALNQIERAEWKLVWLRTEEEALAYFTAPGCSLAIVDDSLDRDRGLNLMRKARACGCDFPMLLVAGKDDPELFEEALRAGAADVLLKKELSGPVLARTVRAIFQRKLLHDERIESEDRFRLA